MSFPIDDNDLDTAEKERNEIQKMKVLYFPYDKKSTLVMYFGTQYLYYQKIESTKTPRKYPFQPERQIGEGIEISKRERYITSTNAPGDLGKKSVYWNESSDNEYRTLKKIFKDSAGFHIDFDDYRVSFQRIDFGTPERRTRRRRRRNANQGDDDDDNRGGSGTEGGDDDINKSGGGGGDDKNDGDDEKKSGKKRKPENRGKDEHEPVEKKQKIG